MTTWHPDFLPGYESTDLPLPGAATAPGEPEDAELVGTLVRRLPTGRPAPRPMDLFGVSIRDGKVYIDTNPTRVTIRWSVEGDATPEEMATFVNGRAGMTMGWTGSFDKLEAALGAEEGVR